MQKNENTALAAELVVLYLEVADMPFEIDFMGL